MKTKLGKLLFFLFAGVTLLSLLSCTSDDDKLFDAIKNGDIEEVKSLIEGGISVLSTNSRGLTALEVARLNNQTEVADYLYGETKKILDRETELLLKIKYPEDLSDLKKLDKQRSDYFIKLTDYNKTLLDYLSIDKRLSEEILLDHEKIFKIHQRAFRDLINAKVDLIENILGDFLDKDFVSSVDSRDARQIVNENILEKLTKTE
ncbi:TPA: hypothetical protein DCR49_08715 [Candidatus Delongbacteria bacterium]|nr:MAG: hypothetical protein A2Y39_01090 [Candidatus Delongbacteria bacterium GWF2_40_14]HAQ62056.1 hypothetical protein [Candidatus Delongbacteria bacterium]